MERKTPEQRRQADEFYENKLMALIEAEFIKKNKKQVYEKAEYFVISVGTSCEPIELNLRLFLPKRILFLYTEQTEKILNKIVQYCAIERLSDIIWNGKSLRRCTLTSPAAQRQCQQRQR